MANTRDTSIIQRHYCGSQILDTARAAKREITNRLNPKWISPADLKSGETPTAVMSALRRSLWEPECYMKAKLNVKSAIYRKAEYTVAPDFVEAVHVERITNEKVLAMTFDWYPDYWLSFVLLSVPAGNMCLYMWDNKYDICLSCLISFRR